MGGREHAAHGARQPQEHGLEDLAQRLGTVALAARHKVGLRRGSKTRGAEAQKTPGASAPPAWDTLSSKAALILT